MQDNSRLLTEVAPRKLTAESVGMCVPSSARGRVHSVFRRACNLELHSGQLVTLLGVELGNLPRGIRCQPSDDSFLERLRPGQAVTIDRGVLCAYAAKLRIDFSRSPIWRCGSVRINTLDAAMLRAVEELRDELCQRMPNGGFSPLLFATGRPRSRLESSIAARLRVTLPALEEAVSRSDTDATAAALAQIVGVGIGLTPSGDDFIVGYLAALRSRACDTPGIGTLLRELAWPLDRLSLRTNAISRQQLIDAVRGRFGQRLCEVLHALARGKDVAVHVRQALCSGYSSGADTLCGLLFGLSPTGMTRTQLPTRRSQPWFAFNFAQTAP
jgi:hypothetical protein